MFVTRSRIVANRARASIKKRHSDSESVRTNQKHAMRECLESSGVIRTRASTAFRKSNRAPFFREIRSFLERGGGRKKKLSAFLRYRATMRTRNAPVYPHVCNIFVTIFKHNTSSSTTSTRRFGIAGVDRPLIGFSRLNAKIYDETFIKIIIIIISSLPPHRDLSHLTTTSKSISLFSKKKRRKKRETQTRKRVVPRKPCVCVYFNVIIYVQNVQEEEDVQNTSSPSLPQTSKDGFDDDGEALSSSSSLSRSSRRRRPPCEEAEER